jgi:F-type H+-transporting ATPase subunit delta
MTKERVARRYAEALVQMAEERKDVETTIKDLEFLRKTIRGSRDLLLFLKSPVIGKPKKQEILRSLFAGKVADATIEFLGVVTLKGREELVPDIVDQFLSIWDERQGVVKVDVKTASEFSRDQSAILEGKLERYTNKKTRIVFEKDAKLMGGFVARVGDTVFDGSVKRQLEMLRQRFVQGEERV